MIAYRIQDKRRGTEYLLDPETQYSWPMDYDESKVRRGISGCETIVELAAYWATHSVEVTDPVLVRVEGPQSEDTPSTGSSGKSWCCLRPQRSLRTPLSGSLKITEKFSTEGLHSSSRGAKIKTSRKQQERFKTMLKFVGYMVAIMAAVAAALGVGVLVTWMIFYGLWYVALILMAIAGVWLGFKYEAKYGHKDEFGDWSEF